MFEYMTAQEAVEKWNITLRLVQRFCKESHIDGVMNINRVWLIPQNAQKPMLGRTLGGRQKKETENEIWLLDH